MGDFESVFGDVSAEEDADAFEDGAGWIGWNGAEFVDAQAVLVQAEEVREGSACVDAEAYDVLPGGHQAGATVLMRVPMGAMVMWISSPACRVKESGGTIPVPVMRKQPWGKLLSR